jgi:hypothetical protein
MRSLLACSSVLCSSLVYRSGLEGGRSASFSDPGGGDTDGDADGAASADDGNDDDGDGYEESCDDGDKVYLMSPSHRLLLGVHDMRRDRKKKEEEERAGDNNDCY